MPPRRLPKDEEEDGGRRRNQFSKDERLHLLNIMSQYAPLLDDTSASVFDRREIWRAIERDFHLAGFTGKTSAQLKKYWQNYKYHGRRAQTGVRKHTNATSKEAMVELPLHSELSENLANLDVTKIARESAAPCVSLRLDASPRNVPESGCRQRQIYGDNGTFFRKLSATTILSTDLDSLGKNQSSSEVSQKKRFSSKVYDELKSLNVIDPKSEKPIGTDVVVSNTDTMDNSVTVSVICPERTPELFNRNQQSKRKREGDVQLDRSSFQNNVSVASAASPCKKRKYDDHSIFPTVAVATKGRCFLLQPRQTDNHDGVISNRENAVEKRRKLKSAKKESTVLPSKFAWPSEVSCSESETSGMFPATSGEDLPIDDPAGSHTRDIRDTICRGGRCDESRIHEIATAKSLRDPRDDLGAEAANDTARSRMPNVGLWDRDANDLLESELRDELDYRLVLHRLETEEKRLKVKIAEMAIQEIRFRIRALNEDVRRADELHELHLALATAQANEARGLHV
ncbi:uncharacterized protein [Polyergus mexicanus]|uniref:uncharacterized protein n=1 Tax=Polyergus mexicanus TaxID=615972 RepID=UPI0038B54F75